MALGYKQLLQVEDAFRTLKSTQELRPVYHRLEDRIRAHVLFCWLALLLIRMAENKTGQTWRTIRTHLERMHAGEFLFPSGRLLQRTETTAIQKQLFKVLKVPGPPKMRAITPFKQPLDKRLRGRSIPQHVGEYLPGNLGVMLPAGGLVGLKMDHDQERVIVQHLLKSCRRAATGIGSFGG